MKEYTNTPILQLHILLKWCILIIQYKQYNTIIIFKAEINRPTAYFVRSKPSH